MANELLLVYSDPVGMGQWWWGGESEKGINRWVEVIEIKENFKMNCNEKGKKKKREE